jgi:hypothetical protein
VELQKSSHACEIIISPENRTHAQTRMLVFVALYHLLGVQLLVSAVRTAEALGTRPAYTNVTSPADCIAKRSTTLAECEIKASKCLNRYDIPMSFFWTPCSAKSLSLGCQCANRCNRKFVWICREKD